MPEKNYKYGNPYKFKALQIYSSVEWMYNSTKKYRRVFDAAEISYLRFHFSFYNKLFDEENWSAKVDIKTFDISKGKRKEICVLSKDIKISKTENIIDVYESWGVDEEGGFWKEGDYICEAYIDNKLCGTQNFYVYNVGKVKGDENPYFEFINLKLYEGDADGVAISNREYLKQFDETSTRYVWAELSIKPKTNKGFYLEFFTRYFDEAGHPKAETVNLDFVPEKSKDNVLYFVRGWGNEDPGSWASHAYSVEINFMETLVVVGVFTFGNKAIPGEIELSEGSRFLTAAEIPQNDTEKDPEEEETLEEVLQKLNDLIGLDSIKQRIRGHMDYLDFIKLRQEKGFKENTNISLHSVFTGNPGTGKTTVVKMLGKIYQKKGLLSKGHVHEVDRSILVGEFIGQTAPKTKEAIKEAAGGILFVDEAYMLVRSTKDDKDFGREVLEVLIKEMSDGQGDIAIMFAGYPKETMYMINSNPGLKSRIKHFFHFEDYTPDELIRIADYAADKRMVTLSNQARKEIKKMLTEAYRNRDNTFGNARFAHSLIDEAKMNMGLRIMKSGNFDQLSKEELSEVSLEDVKKIEAQYSKSPIIIEQDNVLLEEALNELNTLVGMPDIKNQVNELVKLVRYYKEIGKNVLNEFSLHTIFTGNPGTGKTTIARIFGKIFKALGVLERGHLIETGKEGLVAGFVGQTALKTQEVIDKAQGGVLFIDEAYALSGGGGQSNFGHEAIEVILKNMENKRGKFAVIAAGYPDNMAQFLKMNPGLKSRFDRIVHFPDYRPETLYKIAVKMLNQRGLYPDSAAEDLLKSQIINIWKRRDKYFGNARSIRRIAEQAVRNQNLRMADTDPALRTEEMQQVLQTEDLQKIDTEGNVQKSSGIGF